MFAHRSGIGSFDNASVSNQHTHAVETMHQKGEDKPQRSEKREVEVVVKPRFQLTEEEEKEVGVVGWRSISDYIFISKGLIYVWCAAIAQCCFVAFQVTASFWLAFSVEDTDRNDIFVVEIYSLISLLSVVFVHLRAVFAVHLGLKASESFFSGFIDSIFNAPMLFFDSTPVGRILTRV